jgi:MFS family permease
MDFFAALIGNMPFSPSALVLVAFLATLVLTNNIALWMLYLFALTFGLVDAFFRPASMAILPRIVELDNLQAANSLYQATAQFSALLGPVFGWLLASVAGGMASVTLDHYQATFQPLLYGIGLAIVLTLVLEETGPAVHRRAAQAQATARPPA